ncbi:MAG: hypothetical protein A2284_10335 [Deltaproteobacteria bacterium RIFOXYA12_FULL_61_11]|nr:MAG: hypothetical protein A2284_10335 [Deltaproteobacteria bacterium RIFOXYA12_FULL_61_11]
MTEGKNQKILIADDNLATHQIYRRYLKDYPLTVVLDGLEASSLLETETFGLAIIELALPKLSGRELIDKLRGRSPTTPILALAGVVEEKLRAEMAARGVQETLQKPFDVFEFQKKVVAILGFPSLVHSEEDLRNEERAMRIRRLKQELLGKLPTFLASRTVCPDRIQLLVESNQHDEVALVPFLATRLNLEKEVSEKLLDIANTQEYKSFFKTKGVDKAVAKLGGVLTRKILALVFLREFFSSKSKDLPNYLENLWSDLTRKALLLEILFGQDHFVPALLSRLGDGLLLDILTRIKFFLNYANREEMLKDLVQVLPLHSAVSGHLFKRWKIEGLCAKILTAYEEDEQHRTALGLLLTRKFPATRYQLVQYYEEQSALFTQAGHDRATLTTAFDQMEKEIERLTRYGFL